MNQSNLKVLAKGELERLKTEFDQLQTIEQRYSFRKRMLKLCYEGYDISSASLRGFEYEANTTEEIEQLNKLRYSDYINGNNNARSPKEWKELFLERIKTAKNKEAVVAQELENLKSLLSKNYIQRSSFPKKTTVVSYLRKDENFYTGYENYIYSGEEDVDWSEKIYEPDELASIFNGIEWAKYKEFVENYLKPANRKPEIKLTGEQKFLILHYLDFGNEVKANTNKSVLFNFFITELKANSIRPMFSDIIRFETEDNLNAIIDFFRLIKLSPKARYVQKRLDKLYKKR